MSATSPERKRVELNSKLSSLSVELDAWLAASEGGQPLEKHHTQIRAVRRALKVPVDAAAGRIADVGDGEILGQAIAIESMVLELHRIWDFFREKLALRYVEHFTVPLIAADELAWRCYRPARDLLPDGVGREPPLAYLNGAASPLTVERGVTFSAERGAEEPLRWAFTVAAARSLPVAVLGLPWFQVAHLPDLPILAHEVGHNVETDLMLTPSIEQLIDAAAGDDRRALWREWAGEAFADVYAGVALGPAFAATLIDFLAGDAEAIAAEEPIPGASSYPTTSVRVLLAAAVLDATGFAQDGERVRGQWRSYVEHHGAEAFEQDVDPVARALVGGPYPALPCDGLNRLVGFGAARQAQALIDMENLLKGMTMGSDDPRVLVAAARMAFDARPQRYVERDIGQRVMRRIEDKRDVGVRRAAPQPPGDPRAMRDAAAGNRLLEMLDARGTSGGTDV